MMSDGRGRQRRRMRLLPPARDEWEVSPARLFQALLRQNFGAFAERCFYELSPSHTYLHNWHLEALAYHLSEVMNGRCRRLLITLPPRSLKSLFASVALPAFMIGHDPSRKLICISYASEL